MRSSQSQRSGLAAADPIAEVLALGGEPLRRRMARVESDLVSLVGEGGGALASEAVESIAAGGKRLRPLLVFVAGHAAGDGDEQLVRAGVAVELIHSATLVHDDVLDRAPQRRGRSTIYASSGREQATAAGDLLFSTAFAHLVRNGSADQLRVLSAASSALARGELMQREDAWNAAIGVERYMLRCELKTARLFGAACELGALATTATQDARAALSDFGQRIGLAFQILDDVLDIVGDAAETGKRRGTDLLDGTVTLPLILAREADERLAAIDLRAIDGERAAEELCARVAATPGPERARVLAFEHVEEAKRALPAGLEEEQRRMLELIADGVVERYA